MLSLNPDRIHGKWHGRTYHVMRELGRGSAGIVYEVHDGRRKFALKVGEDALSLTSEVNALQQCAQVRGTILGPSLYDVDDWPAPHGTYSFYVMNIIDGMPVQDFLKQRGCEWLPVFVLQLLGFLEQLHQQGWVFGDLKPDNLLVYGSPPSAAWLDPGGMTKMGRSVKEYTERFDRGFWQMGDRKAEPAYDLFSLAMIVLDVQGLVHEYPKQGERPQDFLKQTVFQHDVLYPYHMIIWKALKGEYRQASQMKREWLRAGRDAKHHAGRTRKPVHGLGGSRMYNAAHRAGGTAAGSKKSRKQANQQQTSRTLTVFFVSSFLIFLFALLLFLQVF